MYFQCDFCHIPFIQEDTLKEHKRLYHLRVGDEKDGEYFCQFCPNVFKSRQTRNWNNQRWHSQQLEQRITDAFMAMGIPNPNNEDAVGSTCPDNNITFIQTPKGEFVPLCAEHPCDFNMEPNLVHEHQIEDHPPNSSDMSVNHQNTTGKVTSSLDPLEGSSNTIYLSKPSSNIEASPSVILRAYGQNEETDFRDDELANPNQVMECAPGGGGYFNSRS